MLQPLSILAGAAFTVAVCMALGGWLLRALSVKLYRQEEHPLAFVTGAACLSLLTFILCAAGLARRGVFLALGLAVLAIAIRRGAHRPVGESFPALPPFWKWLFASIFAVYGVVYFFNAMAPQPSPDGVAYHLGLVTRYFRAHGFERISTSMYANISQGIEMLYLFAFAFGRHSAASLTHFAFLVTLTFSILSYARRFAFPVPRISAALLVFVSPWVRLDRCVPSNTATPAA